MPYTIFERTMTRAGSPMVSLSKYGRIVLNKIAADKFHKAGVTSVLLLWDDAERKFAIRPIFKKDKRAYDLHYGNGRATTGGSINCKPFLDAIGADYQRTQQYAADWNEEETMLEVSLPEEAFRSVRQPSLVEFPIRRTNHG